MNVREEDRQKNNCPSRGLGLAAAAIGVGVGAALYCFFSKRPENPDGEGSTTSGWSCEQPHAFDHMHENEDSDPSYVVSSCNEDSYMTISEHSTTDTSIHDSVDTDEDEESESGSEEETDTASDESFTSDVSYSPETGYRTMPMLSAANVTSDSDTLDWDVTTSSVGVPEDVSFTRSPLMALFIISPGPSVRRRTTEEERMTILRNQAFRERSWSLEECSICFDIILKDQQVTTLPCTHHFHSACITPWLQEQQTCPNCRKAAE